MLHSKDHSQSVTWFKLTVFLFLSLLVWQSGIQPAEAQDWTVCKTTGLCDFSSIQAAITGSNNGDVLIFTINKETYTEAVTLNKSLTFSGQTTTINAPNGSTAVTINGSPTVQMENFIIQNGSSTDGAGIRLNGGNLTLLNVTLSGNDATATGGALYIASGSSATLTDVTMSLNTAVTSGGAIYNNGTLTATNLTVTDSTASNGAGLYNNNTALINDGTFQRNTAAQNGGALYNALSGDLTLEISGISNNDASNGAGVANVGSLQLVDTNIGSGNEATGAGGGLHNSGQATLTRSTIVQNTGATAGGIYNTGTLNATNSTLSRNTSDNGAGLYNQNGSATLNNVTIHLSIGLSLYANGGTVTLGNTILSSAVSYQTCGGTGQVITNGYNLSADQTCTFLTAPSDITNKDPLLEGIIFPSDGAAYHQPKLNSPVVNAGNPATPGSSSTACLVSDQRGQERPLNNRCDIGAVEILVYRIFIPAFLK